MKQKDIPPKSAATTNLTLEQATEITAQIECKIIEVINKKSETNLTNNPNQKTPENKTFIDLTKDPLPSLRKQFPEESIFSKQKIQKKYFLQVYETKILCDLLYERGMIEIVGFGAKFDPAHPQSLSYQTTDKINTPLEQLPPFRIHPSYKTITSLQKINNILKYLLPYLLKGHAPLPTSELKTFLDQHLNLSQQTNVITELKKVVLIKKVDETNQKSPYRLVPTLFPNLQAQITQRLVENVLNK